MQVSVCENPSALHQTMLRLLSYLSETEKGIYAELLSAGKDTAAPPTALFYAVSISSGCILTPTLLPSSSTFTINSC
jgi:hypothetical protein